MPISGLLRLSWSLCLASLVLIGVGLVRPVFGGIRMGVRSEVEYSDNILLEESGKMSDRIYRIFPWIDIGERWSRLQVDVNYHPSYTWYETSREYNLAGHLLETNVLLNATKYFNVSFGQCFERTEEGTSDRSGSQDLTRLPYTRLSSVFSGTLATGRDETLGFSLEGESLDYDAQSASQDSTEAQGRVHGRRKMTDGVTGTLESAYLMGRYDDSSTYRLCNGTLGAGYALNAKKQIFGRLGFSRYVGSSRTDYATLNPFVGMARHYEAGHYDIGAGVLIRDQEGTETTYQLSVVGNADVKKRWRRGEVVVSFSSGHEEEYIDSDNPGFDTFVSGTASGWYGISRDWKVAAQVELRDDSYLENRPGKPDRNDVTVTLTGGVEYQFVKQATLKLDYTCRARRSNIDEHEYNENSIVLSLNCFTP